MKTKVIFRIKKDDLIAIFPEIPEDRHGWACGAYAHVGQHGACSPRIAEYGYRLATPAEYAPLKRELESIGYDLEIVSRITPKMTAARRAAAQA